MSEALKKVIEFKRNLIRELLYDCTGSQIELFNRIYKSVEQIEESKLDQAILLCERTVIKNKSKK